MECQFCKSILKTLSSLNYHMKNNKKCLEIQYETVDNVKSDLIICEYCNKSFSNIKKHSNICKEKKKEIKEKFELEFENFKIENEKMQDDYEKRYKNSKNI